MVKESKKLDFSTTGRQLSDRDFFRISEWIKKRKSKKAARSKKMVR